MLSPWKIKWTNCKPKQRRSGTFRTAPCYVSHVWESGHPTSPLHRQATRSSEPTGMPRSVARPTGEEWQSSSSGPSARTVRLYQNLALERRRLHWKTYTTWPMSMKTRILTLPLLFWGTSTTVISGKLCQSCISLWLFPPEGIIHWTTATVTSERHIVLNQNLTLENQTI